jgi:hypothetical protein
VSAPAKATLFAIDKGGNVVDTIPVQFNPGSMRLQMANSVDGGASRGRQTQQYNGSASTTLTLDLEFDTADEGTDANPVSVLDRTDRVRQFVLPGGTESKQAPPRARFRWGSFELTGVMDSLTEELGFFSSEGVPLRSKLSISIKEQDSRFAALERGAGANDDTSPPAAGEGSAGAGPGTSGGGLLDSAAAALSGETAADFLARNGLAPEAWRALGGALDALGDGISLEAGATIGFSAGASLDAGLGLSAGFQAGIDASFDASLGLGAAVGSSVGLESGFALAGAGGLTAAIDQATTASTTAAADAARASFDLPPRPSVAATPPTSARSATSATSVGSRSAAAPIVPAPAPDARATTFGRGVPLRDRAGATGATGARPVVGAGTGGLPPTSGSRLAPWERVAESGRAGDHEQSGRRPGCGCHHCAGVRR